MLSSWKKVMVDDLKWRRDGSLLAGVTECAARWPETNIVWRVPESREISLALVEYKTRDSVRMHQVEPWKIEGDWWEGVCRSREWFLYLTDNELTWTTSTGWRAGEIHGGCAAEGSVRTKSDRLFRATEDDRRRTASSQCVKRMNQWHPPCRRLTRRGRELNPVSLFLTASGWSDRPSSEVEECVRLASYDWHHLNASLATQPIT